MTISQTLMNLINEKCKELCNEINYACTGNEKPLCSSLVLSEQKEASRETEYFLSQVKSA